MDIIIVIISILFLSITNAQSDTSVQSLKPSIFNCAYTCLICDYTTLTCQTCVIGSVLSNLGGCESCSSNCLSCSSISKCTKCAQSSVIFTIPQGTYCLPCSEGCISCETLTTISQSEIRLTYCTECSPSFYLTESITTSLLICSPCTQGCAYCNNSLTCNECLVGWTLNETSGNCDDCSDNCKLCNSNLECMECELGYFLTTNGDTCSPCPTNCLICTDSLTCNFCVYDYYLPLEESICQVCLFPCRMCNATMCFKCSSGSYLNNSISKFINNETGNEEYVIDYAQCVQCENGCLECTSLGCSQCYQHFFLSTNGTCLECEDECLDCEDSESCKICSYGYYMLSGQCFSCPDNCGSCVYTTIPPDNEGPMVVVCLYCSGYYILVNESSCVSCTEFIEGCQSCNYALQCILCSEGYTLDENTCLKNGPDPEPIPIPVPVPDNDSGIGTVYIVMFCIGGAIVLGAIGFGVWSWWKGRVKENEERSGDNYLEIF